ncbi:MAG: helix-turn-helix domain-containing protein [Magnetococcales bacterium]|nr:helix-turn-helix domain-containing protein [Magnetococcales bacterium]
MTRFAILPIDVFQDPRLSRADIRILGIIAAHASKSGEAWPSRMLIAKLSGYALPNVTRSTSRLVQYEYLSKVGKKGKAIKYMLNFRLYPKSSQTMSEGVKMLELIPPNREMSELIPVGKKDAGIDTGWYQFHTSTGIKSTPRSNEEQTKNTPLQQTRPIDRPGPVNCIQSPTGDGGGGCGGGDFSSLFFPPAFSDQQKRSALIILNKIQDENLRQSLLDELSGALEVPGRVRSPAHFLKALRDAQMTGNFFPDLGLEIAARRERAKSGEGEELKGPIIRMMEERERKERATRKADAEEAMARMKKENPTMAAMFERIRKMTVKTDAKTPTQPPRKN